MTEKGEKKRGKEEESIYLSHLISEKGGEKGKRSPFTSQRGEKEKSREGDSRERREKEKNFH